MSLDTTEQVKDYCLERAGEATDGTSPLDTLTDNFLIEAWRDLNSRHPWLGNVKFPPGALLTTAKVTTLTVTASAGTAVAATLSATHATSLTGYLYLPDGKSWYARVTAHTAGASSATLDAVPEAITTKAGTFAQIEYDLAADLGIFVDGLWTPDGRFVPLKSEEYLKGKYAGRPSNSWPPECFARVGQQKIRLSSYSTDRERLEYPYATLPDDPSGTLSIAEYLTPVFAEGVLSLLYEKKEDARVTLAAQRYERGISRAKEWETILKTGLGNASGNRPQGPYG